MEFLYFLESIRNGVLNIFFIICTSFGEELVLISLFAIIYWCINKKLAYRIAFSYFMSGIVVQGLKIHFRIERPWVIDPDFKPVEAVMDTATGYSFRAATPRVLPAFTARLHSTLKSAACTSCPSCLSRWSCSRECISAAIHLRMCS